MRLRLEQIGQAVNGFLTTFSDNLFLTTIVRFLTAFSDHPFHTAFANATIIAATDRLKKTALRFINIKRFYLLTCFRVKILIAATSRLLIVPRHACIMGIDNLSGLILCDLSVNMAYRSFDEK